MRRSREPSQVSSADGEAIDAALTNPRRKWSSALKVVHAMTRFKRGGNMVSSVNIPWPSLALWPNIFMTFEDIRVFYYGNVKSEQPPTSNSCPRDIRRGRGR